MEMLASFHTVYTIYQLAEYILHIQWHLQWVSIAWVQYDFCEKVEIRLCPEILSTQTCTFGPQTCTLKP